MRNSRLIIALLAAGVLGLTGCAQDNSLPEPETATKTGNIISAQKYSELVDEVSEALSQADKNHDVDALGNRIAGPLLTQRKAEYSLASATEATAPTPFALDPKEATMASGVAFPRTLMAIDVSKTPRGIGTIAVWQQATARENYQLWAAIDMFPSPPKIEITNTQNDSKGYLAMNADDFVTDPAGVLDAYASYANARQMGDVKFNEGDPLYEQTAKQASDLTAALNQLGEAKIAFSVPNKDIRAVSTKDGGIVMVGELRYDMTVTRTKDGATLKLGSLIGALSEGKKDGVITVDKPVVAQYSTSVAFYVPPKGSKEPVHMIGGSVPALVSVTKAE